MIPLPFIRKIPRKLVPFTKTILYLEYRQVMRNPIRKISGTLGIQSVSISIEGYDIDNFEDKSRGQHSKSYHEGANGASLN